MAQKLTDAFISKTSRRGVVWDTLATGLGLKVLPSGAKVWLLQVKLPGKSFQSKLRLGGYPGTTLGDVRHKAESWRGLIANGIDPREAEADERRKLEAARRAEAQKRESTFGAFAERYIAKRTNRRAKSDGQEIRRELIAFWRDRPIHEITPRDVREVIEKLKSRSPYEAKNAWTHANGIFKTAVHEELIDVSPCASLDKKLLFKGAKMGHRQRVLNDDEIFAFWRATYRLDDPAGQFYRCLLLTACRKSELGKGKMNELHPQLRRLMREAKGQDRPVDWKAVAASTKVLVVPRERFKSDAEHRVQLTDDALEILRSLYRDNHKFIFTSPVNDDSPLWLGNKFKDRLDARMLRTLRALARTRGDDPKSVTLPHWINHDLRRTARTNLAALDVPDHIAEMVLGHGRKGLQRIYDQHKYEAQIRGALELWADRLRSIARPLQAETAHNVVALRVKR